MRRPLLLAEGPPDVHGVRPKTDQAARNRFDEFIQGRRLKLLANYGEMDILWAELWESLRAFLRSSAFSLKRRRRHKVGGVSPGKAIV